MSVVVLLIANHSFAQLPIKNVNTFKIQVADGLYQSRVDQMIYDNQGVLWLSLKNKLQLWDGQEVMTVHDTIIERTSQYNLYKHPEEGVVITTPGLVRQFSYQGLAKKTLYQSKRRVNLTEIFSPVPIFKDGQIKYVVTRDSLVSDVINSEQYKVDVLFAIWEKHNTGRCELSIDGTNYIQLLGNNLLIDIGDFEGSSIEKLLEVKWLRSNYSITSGRLVFATNSSLVIQDAKQVRKYKFPESINMEFYSTVIQAGSSSYIVGVDNRLFLFDIEKEEWLYEYRDISNDKLLKSESVIWLIRNLYLRSS